MSDEKIAQELNIPRILVETLRETAYGPIRANPEIEKMAHAVIALRATLTKVQGEVDAIEARLKELRA